MIALAVVEPRTGSTHTPTQWASIGVGFVEGVTALAVRFVEVGRKGTYLHVLVRRNSLKVAGIYTRSIKAKMINVQAAWDRAYQLLIGITMGANRFLFRQAEGAIPIDVCPHPLPARIRDANLIPESLDGAPGATLPCIVARTTAYGNWGALGVGADSHPRGV